MLSNDIVKFAGDNVDFYKGFVEFMGKDNKTQEDKDALHTEFFAEVDRVAGVNFEGVSQAAKMSNPTYRWAFMSVVDATINAILPQVLLPQLGMFMDLRFVGIGDIVKFKLQPNNFYTVSLGNLYRPAC